MRLDQERTNLLQKLERIQLRKTTQKISSRAKPKGTGRRDSAQSQITASRGKRTHKKRRHVPVLEQWIEIETQDTGAVWTTLFPSNETLLPHVQEMEPAPELVYRRLHFVNGVPPEYSWATANLSLRASGGMGIQRMKIETWLRLIEREKSLPDGRLLPIANLPRPQERGGCECEVCTKNETLIKT